MKFFLSFAYLFLLLSCNHQKEVDTPVIKPSQINSLKNDKEVEQFIRNSDSLYKKFTLKKVQDIQCHGCDTSIVNLANRLHVDYTYIKADLDNNGYMDIIATGTNKTYISENYDPDLLVEFSKDFNAFVIMDFGEGKTSLYDLTDGHYRGVVPAVEYKDNRNLLVVYSPRNYHRLERLRRDEVKSELTFKFNDFIEYNPSPKAYNIDKIEYSTKGCTGECPVFSIEINQKGESFFKATFYNYTEDWQQGELLEGVYETIVSDESLHEITQLLNYTDFPNLKNEYNVLWTCDQTGVLKITYNNGKVKTITDYGLQGTYGLRVLHKKLFKLRVNQDWKQK